jgi:hypothetical protein
MSATTLLKTVVDNVEAKVLERSPPGAPFYGSQACPSPSASKP